ncbi:MAG: pyridoxal phosphate-dependent decarboxylase family protein [Ignavibacteriaceae bacterium]
MIEKIKYLENLASPLEPSKTEREALIKTILDYSEDFLQNIDKLPAYVSSESKAIEIYDSPIEEDALEIDKILEMLKNNVDTPGLNPASGGHLGYIPGGGIFHSALGDYLAAVTNRYAGIFFASPGAVRMEHLLLSWIGELFGYPKTSGGNLTSGGSIANLIAIVTARDAFGLKGKDLEKTVIYLSEHAHHSVEKAIRIAGLNECIIRYVQLNSNFRMDSTLLELTINEDKRKGLKPWLIIASAGTTDVGAIDPLSEIGIISEKHNMWFHIDAAYGGFFILSDTCKNSLKGLDKSDSIIVDPHKGLFIPYGSGAVLIKNKENLLASHYYHANYMQDALTSTEEYSPADLSPELSKHFRGLRLWLPLKLVGLRPFRAMLEEKIQLARYFFDKVQQIPGIEVGPFPDLSIVIFRYVPTKGDADTFNKKLVNAIQKDGRVFLSSTIINSRFTLRLAVLSFRTHLSIIDTTLEILKEKINELNNS